MSDARIGMAYIGVEPGCGCVTAAIALGYASRSEEAEEVADLIKSGRVVEHVTVDEARRRLTLSCPHGPHSVESRARTASGQTVLAVRDE